jgi:hypothetical protein
MLHRLISIMLLIAMWAGPFLPVSAQNERTPLTPPTDAIQVQELASLNPNEIGLLDEQHGGLGLTLWADSSLGLVSKALPLLPNQPSWRSLRALELRLLESAANMPAGKASAEQLIALRAGKLASMGATETTLALLKMVPNPSMTPILRRLQIDSALLSGDLATACAQEPAFRVAQSNDNYATELQVLCQYQAGKGAEAALGIDLLRDQKLHDPLFLAAADMVGGLPPAKLDRISDASPVAMALANFAKFPLPDAAVSTSPAGYLATLAQAPGASPETRLMAAERAVALGVNGPEPLRRTIEAVAFTPAELATAANETGKTAKSRALLYKAAFEQALPSGRAELIQRGLAAGPATAPWLYGAMLASLPATPEMAGFAPWAVRALLMTGQAEAARPWLGLLRADALLNGPSAMTLATLRPLARLAGLGDALTAGDLAAWRQARNESAGDSAKHGLLLLTLLTALGDTPPENDWVGLLDGAPLITGKISRSALTTGLLSASAGHRRGETVLYGLLSLGDQRDVEPGEFAAIIIALRAVGLEADARAFAVELALAYGI